MATANSAEPNTTALPSRVPPPTGSLARDVWESIKHMTDVPCARGALMGGIASGAGIGFMRGLSTGVLLAGHWAIATFAVVSLGSWHICQRQIADERNKVAKIMETAPRRIKPQNEEQAPTSER